MATSFSGTGIRLDATQFPTPGNPVRVCTPTLAVGWYRLLVRFYADSILSTSTSFAFILRHRVGPGRTSHFVKWHQYGDGGGGGAGLANPAEWSSAMPVDFHGGSLELFVAWNQLSPAIAIPMQFDVDIQPLGGSARQCTLSNLIGLQDFAKNEPAVVQVNNCELQPLAKRVVIAIKFHPGGVDSGAFNFYGYPRSGNLLPDDWHRFGHPYLPNFVRTKFDGLTRSDTCIFEIEPRIWQLFGYTIEGFNVPNGAVDSLFPGTLRVFEMVDVP